MPWGLCGAGAVGLGVRCLPRRCLPSSTSVNGTGRGTGTAGPGRHSCLLAALRGAGAPLPIPFLPVGKAPRRGRSRVYRSRL